MPRTRTIRIALWTSVGLNALGVAVFAPVALGHPSTLLPVDTPPFYAAQIGFVIALFGGVYAWLARQARIDRALVVVGGLGKLGFFALTVAYWVVGDLPASMAVNATPDLLLASVFLWWARTTASR